MFLRRRTNPHPKPTRPSRRTHERIAPPGSALRNVGYGLHPNVRTTDDEVLAFDRAFGIDSLADLIVCVACLDGWEDRHPLAWLDHYQAEDAKLLSREKPLALLDASIPALSRQGREFQFALAGRGHGPALLSNQQTAPAPAR
jgi:hypothetical protein